MPSVNTIITALVAGLAIGAQAGPCRPHPPSSSVVQSQVTTTAYVQPTTETSAAYSDVVSKSETEVSLPTTAVELTSSETAEAKPTTTDEETTTTGYPAAESTSVVSGSLTTDATAESTVESTSVDQETTSTFPSTTQEDSTTLHTTTLVPSTASQAEIVLSTTSSEPQTTVAPTTTSSEPTTTTSQASTTTSEAASSRCANKSSLTCNKTGLFTSSDSNLLQVLYDHNLEQCKAECEKNKDCKTIGITTSDQCELYDASVSVLGFQARDQWYYSVWDACCFLDDQ